MPMTLDQFRATGRDMTNAAGEVTARTYVEVLFIEHWIDGRAGIAPPQGVPTWLLTTDGPEQETGDLATLEPKLYAWAMANGYGDETPAAAPVGIAREFPDYPVTDVPACLTAAGWADWSWHNDACPFFMHEASGVGVWCGYAGAEYRENIGERFVAQAMEWDAACKTWQHDLSGGGVLFETESADILAASLPNFTNMRAIAHAYALAIAEICADELPEIMRRNATDEYATSDASHDCCDANMPMSEAFADVMGRPFVTDNGVADDDLALVNAAWEIARKERLTDTVSEGCTSCAASIETRPVPCDECGHSDEDDSADDAPAPDIATMMFFIAAASNADGVHWSSVIWGGDDSYDNVKAGAELEAGIALGALEVAVTLHGPFIAGSPLPA